MMIFLPMVYCLMLSIFNLISIWLTSLPLENHSMSRRAYLISIFLLVTFSNVAQRFPDNLFP
jgi:hypothetical protein